MRPIKLTMQAFGSYGKKTVIDFTRASRNLFLITGDTGAGKTTIFDAIVFALYGETGSVNNKKDGAELASQYVAVAEEAKKKNADSGRLQTTLQPFVELTFSELVGGAPQIYTVRRSPHYKRPPKRAAAKSEIDVKEVVALTLPDGRDFNGKIHEINQKITEIVGLTQSQFMQIAMIAQGEFMELLRASSDDKKVIFRKLFGTELFPKIVAVLKARRDRKQKEMDTIFAACKAETGRVVMPENEIFVHEENEKNEENEAIKSFAKKEMEGDEKNFSVTAANLKEIQKNILASARLHVPELEHFVTGLQALCEKLEKTMQRMREQEKQARQERDETRDALQQANTLLISFNQLEAEEKKLAACAAKETEIAEAATLLEEINAAYEVQAVYQRLADAEHLLTETKQKLEDQTETLPQLADAFAKASEEEAAAQKVRDEGQEAFAKISERVANALAVFAQIAAATNELARKQATMKQAAQASEAARNALEQFETQEQEWKKEAEALRDAEVLLEQWKAKGEKAQTLQTLWQDSARESKGRQKQKALAADAELAYEKARNAYTDKLDEYNQKNIAFLDAQAGFIAQQLKPGEPCPVCGSREHPQPCKLAEEHTELTRAVIEGLAKEVSALEAESSQRAKAAHGAKELLEEKTKRLRESQAKLRAQMAEAIPDVPETMVLGDAKALINTWQRRLAKEGEALEKNVKTLADIRESMRSADAKKRELKNQNETASQAAIDARTAVAAAEETLKAMSQQKEYASEQEAKRALANAKKEKNKKDAAYHAAHQAMLNAKKAKETAETLIDQCKAALPGYEKERDARNAAYEKILKEKIKQFGFAQQNESATQIKLKNETQTKFENATQTEWIAQKWKAIVATHHKEEVTELQKQISAFTETRIAAQSAAETAKKTIAGRAKPELATLQAAAAAAEEKLAQVQGVLQKTETVFHKNSEACDALANNLEENGKAAREYGRISLLYDRLNGKQTDARMDIETFVQRYYLQRILSAANRRFREMSAGQFELRMTGEEQAGQGKNRGLDLMVYSTVTGKEREVRTLSGGESFMAALSLALGMADQIQESSASLNLDVMFIDEGFGSLDDHSRSQAVRVLKQMVGGSRLIGIISHVSELKQEIEDQLLVTKDSYGSHTRWQIS